MAMVSAICQALSPLGKLAPKPLFRDTVYDGAADPFFCWNRDEQKMFLFTPTARHCPDMPALLGHAPLGIAESADRGATWSYRCQANINTAGRYFPTGRPKYSITTASITVSEFCPRISQRLVGTRYIIHMTSKNLWTGRTAPPQLASIASSTPVLSMPTDCGAVYNNEPDERRYLRRSPTCFPGRTWEMSSATSPAKAPRSFNGRAGTGWSWMSAGLASIAHRTAKLGRAKENLLENPAPA